MHVVPGCCLTEFVMLLERQIRYDHAVDPKLRTLIKEEICPRAEDRIRVQHQKQRHVRLLTQACHHFKDACQRGVIIPQRTQACLLDDLALRDRIGERNADLNDVHTALLHRKNSLLGRLISGISGKNICYKCLFAGLFQLFKLCVNSVSH